MSQKSWDTFSKPAAPTSVPGLLRHILDGTSDRNSRPVREEPSDREDDETNKSGLTQTIILWTLQRKGKAARRRGGGGGGGGGGWQRKHSSSPPPSPIRRSFVRSLALFRPPRGSSPSDRERRRSLCTAAALLPLLGDLQSSHQLLGSAHSSRRDCVLGSISRVIRSAGKSGRASEVK